MQNVFFSDDLPFDISPKRLQSELGAVGEYSPNIERVIEQLKEMHGTFDHTHGTITNDDAVLCLVQTYAGQSVNGEEKMFGTHVAIRGCYHNMEDLLTTLFLNKPDYIQIATNAIGRALMKIARSGGEGDDSTPPPEDNLN